MQSTRPLGKPFCVIAICALFMEIVAGLVVLFAAGGGHGTYLPAKLLFPYTMLMTLPNGFMTAPAIGLALTQFLAYGALYAWAFVQGAERRALRVLIIFHAVAVLIALVLLSGPNYR